MTRLRTNEVTFEDESFLIHLGRGGLAAWQVQAHEYGQVILPFTVLRLMDCVLEPTKKAVLKEAAKREFSAVSVNPFLTRASGATFYNTSPMDLKAKAPAYVASRARLTELIPAVVEAFYAEEIGVGHALLLAKLQPAQQEAALASCFREDWGGAAGKAKRIVLPVRHLQ